MTERALLHRRVFATSRLAEFCSKSELEKQTGHPVEQWPVVIIKELVDNALDEAERAGIAPEIELKVEAGLITVSDNGGGLAPETIAKILDYTVRVSDKEAYASPTRGAQGNALKTVLAMPFALDGNVGRTTIESRGICHDITFMIDPIRREPKIEHTSGSSLVKNGTRIKVHLPETPRPEESHLSTWFLQVGQDFSALNPHLALTSPSLKLAQSCSDPDWRKWTPADAIPAHWYSAERFERLIGAHIAYDQDNGNKITTVREFVATFRGMSGTAKQKAVLEATGTARLSLADFFANGNNREAVRGLLDAMRTATKPVKAGDLGSIGRKHIEDYFEQYGAQTETFQYIRRTGENAAGLPFVLEVAFAWCPEQRSRSLITGLNFSPTLSNPFRRLGTWGPSLDQVLTDQYAGDDEPVMVLVHLTCPVMAFTDRGKSTLAIDVMTGDAVKNAVLAVTKKWANTRKQEDKHEAARARRHEKMVRQKRITVKEAAYSVMEQAWLKASANGTLPANARQIMYAARDAIQDLTGKKLDSKYFTQTLLPDYVDERDLDWDVVFDDRGHFIEPHGGPTIGLGTLNVRSYLAQRHAPRIINGCFSGAAVATLGPDGNYGAVLFIEKEGFLPLLKRVDLANRFDIAIMSTKGVSVTAARKLAEAICSARGIPLLILHDFDKAGFSIKSMLHSDTRRYQFKDKLQVIDLGLRLADVKAVGLEAKAEAIFDKGSREARAANLHKNGATEKEVFFLLERRVELNAMTSEQFVAFVERKLIEHGIRKVVPDADILAKTYCACVRAEKLREIVKRAIAETPDETIIVSKTLADHVANLLRKNPSRRWDTAVAEITDRSLHRKRRP